MSLLDSDSLPHAIDIAHVSYANDSLGGDVPTEASAYAANQPAWVQPSSAASIKEFKLRNMNVTHDVYLNENPGLRLDDVITVTSGPYEDATLTIKGFRECTAGLGYGWLVVCEISREP